jgi:hypothetical protein
MGLEKKGKCTFPPVSLPPSVLHPPLDPGTYDSQGRFLVHVLVARELERAQGIRRSNMVVRKERSVNHEVEFRQAKVIDRRGRQPFQMSSQFVAEVSDAACPEGREVRPRFVSVGSEEPLEDIKRIGSQGLASSSWQSIQKDLVAVSINDQEGLEADEGVIAQGVVPSAEQQRLVRPWIEQRKQTLRWDIEIALGCNERLRSRCGKLDRQDRILQQLILC